MFRKLVANLPFNPSLLQNLAFYSARLRAENAVRRLGFTFMALALMLQIFAVVAPPQKSLAASGNDIINGGVTTRDQLLRNYDSAGSDLPAIFTRFGVSRSDLAALPATANATVSSGDNEWWSIGRTPLSGYSDIDQAYKNNDIPITAGGTTVYMRQLHAWDRGGVSSYQAFKGTTASGLTFWILTDCGNLTFYKKPPLKAPGLEFRKTINGGPRTLKPGDTYSYHFEYRNPVADSTPAEGVVIEDWLELSYFDIVSFPPNHVISNNQMLIKIPGPVPYSPTMRSAGDLTVRLKKDLNNGLAVCNAATIFMNDGATKAAESGGAPNGCVTVQNVCPIDASISSTDAKCATPNLVCTMTGATVNRTTKQVTLKTNVSSTNPAQTKPVSYTYDFGDSAAKRTVASSNLSDSVTHTYKDGTFRATVNVAYRVGTVTTQAPQNVICAASIDISPDQPLGQSKLATNITQNKSGADAASTTARAGDVIEYTLMTRNSFNYDRTAYTISDNVADVLEYTDLDLAFLRQQGGTFDESSKSVVWANQTISANDNDVKKFRVRIKENLPATNQPNTMSTTYDCRISNKYGTEISIPVGCPTPKAVETVAKTLPNTGPGTSVFFGFVGLTVVGYFVARTRLMQKELELIRVEYATGGGF